MSDTPFGQVGFLGVLVLFGAIQGLFLAGFFLVRRRGDRVANRLLSLLIGLISIHLAELTLGNTSLIQKAPYLDATTFPLIFLIGPVYFFYVRRLLEPGAGWRWIDLLHALPAAYVAWANMPWYLTPAEQKLAYYQWLAEGNPVPISLSLYLVLAFNIVQNLVYLGLSVRRIREAEGRVKESTSDNAFVVSVVSLKRLSSGFALWILTYLVAFFALIRWGEYGIFVDQLWLLVTAVFIQANGVVAMVRPETFHHEVRIVAVGVSEAERSPTDRAGLHASNDAGYSSEKLPEEGLETPSGTNVLPGNNESSTVAESTQNEKPSHPRSRVRYEKSSIAPELAAAFHERFESLMETEKPFLEPSLKLSDLADQLGISSHHLSQILNVERRQNFFEVVNRYRVEEAQRLLIDPETENLTVLAIAYRAGFNNKNSFNRAFKQYTGETPSGFRRRMQQSAS